MKQVTHLDYKDFVRPTLAQAILAFNEVLETADVYIASTGRWHFSNDDNDIDGAVEFISRVGILISEASNDDLPISRA